MWLITFLVFDRATDRLFDHLGIGAAYRHASNHSMFALEAHVTYERELREGARFVVDTRLVDIDQKRLHIFHELYRQDDGALAATAEFLALHVNLSGPRAAPLPQVSLAKAEALLAENRKLPAPPQLGRRIGIRR
jgi:acyl-CoA thioester hydrolase